MARSDHDHDPVEGALATALTEAAAAGRFDVVAQLADELKARRAKREPPSSNIVTFADRRRRRG